MGAEFYMQIDGQTDTGTENDANSRSSPFFDNAYKT
jgi:hypothetical protein